MEQEQPSRRARAATAARTTAAAALAWLAGVADRWDAICSVGLVLLAVGLARTFDLGVSLSVVGALLLVLGVAGARAAAQPSVGEAAERYQYQRDG